jgi:hypothetical protein
MTLTELRKALALLPDAAGDDPVIMGDNVRTSLQSVVMSVDPINGTTIRLYGQRNADPTKGA